MTETAVLEQPILCNYNNYPVLVKVPNGSWLNIPGNLRAAVCGPGFERYIENGTLTRVGNDYAGPILYSPPPLPVDIKVTVPPEIKIPVSPPTLLESAIDALTFPAPEEATAHVLDSTVEEVSLPPDSFSVVVSPEPVMRPSEPIVEASAVASEAPSLPSRQRLAALSREELSKIAGRLNLKIEGTRNQLLARLSPIAKE